MAVNANPGDFFSCRSAILRSFPIMASAAGDYACGRQMVPFELRCVVDGLWTAEKAGSLTPCVWLRSLKMDGL